MCAAKKSSTQTNLVANLVLWKTRYGTTVAHSGSNPITISKASMREIQLTQGKVALVDDIDYEYLMQFNWYAMRQVRKYRPVRSLKKADGAWVTVYMYHDIAERMGIDLEAASHIDHIDNETLNNCRSNLRAATVSQNLHNTGVPRNSKTGVKGVCFHKASGQYQAKICVRGKLHWLGTHVTIAEAERVIVAKREELCGEFACHG